MSKSKNLMQRIKMAEKSLNNLGYIAIVIFADCAIPLQETNDIVGHPHLWLGPATVFKSKQAVNAALKRTKRLGKIMGCAWTFLDTVGIYPVVR